MYAALYQRSGAVVRTVQQTWRPGILSPRVKYSVLEELRSADVPIPYLLFSQTKTQGRSHSFAYGHIHSQSFTSGEVIAHHVERLKDLTLVARTVTVEGKRGGLVAEVLLGEGEARADGDLSANNAVTTKEGRSEDVHRTTLSARHAVLTTEELSEDAFDGAPTHDCKGMTPVGGNDAVFRFDTVFKADRDGFLGRDEQTTTGAGKRTDLSNGEMAETTDEFSFVECVGCHFHATHGLHVLVHFEEFVLLDLDFEGRWVAFVGTEGVLVESDGERLGFVGDGVVQLCSVCRGGDGPRQRRLEGGKKVSFFKEMAGQGYERRDGQWRDISGRGRPWVEEKEDKESEREPDRQARHEKLRVYAERPRQSLVQTQPPLIIGHFQYTSTTTNTLHRFGARSLIENVV